MKKRKTQISRILPIFIILLVFLFSFLFYISCNEVNAKSGIFENNKAPAKSVSMQENKNPLEIKSVPEIASAQLQLNDNPGNSKLSPELKSIKTDKVKVIIELDQSSQIQQTAPSNPSGKIGIKSTISQQAQTPEQIQNSLASISTDSKLEKIANGKFQALTVSKNDLSKLEAMPNVKKIWEDTEVHALLDIAEPMISADYVHNLGFNGSGIKVCALDTGINSSHSGFDGRVVNQSDFTSSLSGYMDIYGHGTHVAGIVGSQNETYKGIAPGAILMNAKVLNDSGVGYNSWIINGVDWCIANGADILTLSLGSSVNSTDGSDLLSSYLDATVEQGKIITVAAGNSGPSSSTIDCPGCAKKVITVGAVYEQNYGVLGWSGCTDTSTSKNLITCFSSRGPTTDSRQKPDVVAPGAQIVSLSNNGVGTVTGSGTSMATPMVAGMAALLLQARPSLSPEEAKALIMNSVYDYDSFVKDNIYGIGMVNVSRAFSEINNTKLGNITPSSPIYYNVYLPNASSDFRVTLYWPENYSYHNDADLYILDPSGNIQNQSTSQYQTDEFVKIISPYVSGNWKIKVVPYNVSGTQKFALASNYKINSEVYFSNATLTYTNSTYFHYINVTNITGNSSKINLSLDWNNSAQLINIYLYNTSSDLASSVSSSNSSNTLNISYNIPSGETGNWLARISATNLTSNSTPSSQPYSLTANYPITQYYTDSAFPTISLVSPANSTTINSSTTISLSVTDDFVVGTVLYDYGTGNLTLNLPYAINAENFTRGTNFLNITANDTSGHTSSLMLQYNYNNVPAIHSTPFANATEGIFYNYTMNATDPDNDTLSYSFSSSPDIPSVSGNFSFNNLTGSFNWTPQNNNSGNYFNITIIVNDTELSASQNFLLYVIPTNDAPILTSPLPDITFPENSYNNSIILSQYFSDIDNATLFYGYAANNSNITITFYQNTSMKINATAYWSGIASVNITASDGQYITNDSIIVNVSYVNQAPVLSSIPNILANETDLVDINATGNLTAVDPDNELLTYSFTSPLNSSGQWLTDYYSARNYTVNVTVNDSQGGIDSQIVRITILDKPFGSNDTYEGNISDVITNIPNLSVVINGTSFNLSNPLVGFVPVNFTNSETNKTIVIFNYNLTNTTKLNFINIKINQTFFNGSESLVVKGINIANTGATKTIYLNQTNISLNSVCIKDAEIDSIEEMSSTCGGTSETKVACDGAVTGNYTCTLSGTTYAIIGLSHSGIKQISYDRPVTESSTPSAGSGGGGGGGASSTTWICNKNWSCTAWSSCSYNREQTRTCTLVSVADYSQPEKCPTFDNPLPITQSCTLPQSEILAQNLSKLLSSEENTSLNNSNTSGIPINERLSIKSAGIASLINIWTISYFVIVILAFFYIRNLILVNKLKKSEKLREK